MFKILSEMECALEAISTGRVPDVACLRAVLSKVLGYGMVVGGAVVKIPQVNVDMLKSTWHSNGQEAINLPNAFTIKVACFAINTMSAYFSVGSRLWNGGGWSRSQDSPRK